MPTAVQSVRLKTNQGADASMSDYAGKVVLVVNVASKCGLTPQYEGLEALYRKYRDRGFVVAGFPSNDFAGQEPGTDEEIAAFCATSYDVDFPIFAKAGIVGPDKHPLYAALIDARPKATGGAMRERLAGYGMTPNPEPEVLWNFEKFLIGRSGDVVARFGPDVAPDDAMVVEAIERELEEE